MTQVEKISEVLHTLLRPDYQIGDLTEQNVFIPLTNEKNQMRFQQAKIIPGFINCFNEMLINARDQNHKDINSNEIIVEINLKEQYISVQNNGNGVNTDFQDKHQLYNPHIAFFNFRSSTNYNDSQKRFTGGKNGLGIKIVGALSRKFIIETVYQENNIKTHYKQFSQDNMDFISEPEVKQVQDLKPFTKVTFYHDFTLGRLKVQKYQQETYKQTQKEQSQILIPNKQINQTDVEYIRSLIIFAGQSNSFSNKRTNQKLIVIDNEGNKISNNLYYHKLIDLQTSCINYEMNQQIKYYEFNSIKNNTGWQILFFFDKQIKIGVTNGIYQSNQGSHIKEIYKQITQFIKNKYEEQTKEDINHKTLQTNIIKISSLYVSCVINAPDFQEQTKQTLITTKFDPELKLDDIILLQIYKSKQIKEMLDNVNKEKGLKMLQTSDIKRGTIIKQLDNDKIVHAKNIGTGQDNYIFLCEGDSAKNFIVSMLNGDNSKYGYIALQGKIMNYRKTDLETISKSKMFILIKQALGLKNDQKKQNPLYTNIVIASDFDDDGFHICGLLISMFELYWPELLITMKIKQLRTSVVRIQDKNENILKEFFTFQDFKDYYKLNNVQKEKIDFNKGLGSNTRSYGNHIFGDKGTQLNSNIVTFNYKEIRDQQTIELAFGKDQEEQRKTWLQNHYINKKQDQNCNQIDYKQKIINVNDFINKVVINYAISSLSRAIPNYLDSFKEVQRKIMYTVIKKMKQDKTVSVVQFGGEVIKFVGYHHGEQSLYKAITKMGNELFNNINLIHGIGQFGTLHDNKSSSPRYLKMKQQDLTKKIFELDYLSLLDVNDQDFDNDKVPKFLYPLIPLILINGAKGIACAYSTKINQYDVNQIIDLLIKRLDIKINKQNKTNKLNDQLNYTDYMISPNFADFKGFYYNNLDDLQELDEKEQLNKIIWYSCPLMQIYPNKNSIKIQSFKPLQTYSKFISKLQSRFKNDQIEISGGPGPKIANLEIIIKDKTILDLSTLKLVNDFKNVSKDDLITYQKNCKIIAKELHLIKKIDSQNLTTLDENEEIKIFDNLKTLIDQYYKQIISYQNKVIIYEKLNINQQLDMINHQLKFQDLIKRRIITFDQNTDQDKLQEILITNFIPEKSIYNDNIHNKLVDHKISSLLKNKTKELNNQKNKLEDEIQKWTDTCAEQLWRDKLIDIKKDIKEFYIERDQRDSTQINK